MEWIAAILVFIFALSVTSFTVHADRPSVVQLFVAPDGSDENDGSITGPFATLEKARDTVRLLRKPAVVNLRAGVYHLSTSFLLDERDKDTVYRAYRQEEVILTEAADISLDQFHPLSDDALKKRLSDPTVAEHLLVADLKALGINELGSLKITGQGNFYPDTGYPPVLYAGQQRLTLARYPNEGYLPIDKVIDEGTILSWSGEADSPPDPSVKLEGLRILVKDTRLENWKQAGDIWAFGYFKHDWAESNLPVTVKGDGEVVSSFPSIYGVDQGQRLYFYNLFEEIDQPGEWYLDRETGLLYLYPPKNAESVSFVADEYPFFVLEGSSRITLKGLRFKKGIGNGIKISNAREVTVVDCMISLVSNDALVIDNSVECEAVNNIIYDVGASGIVIRCGDRKTLTPGDTKAINNTITRFSQIRTTYTPGIDLQGVGNTALHNQISDAPHFAIRFGGNDHTIEYNDISKVCTDTVDSGAIYAGRDWTCRGNRIRYNYIHDMKLPECNTGFKIHAVYLDDMFSSAEVFGNIFYKIESVALFGGGRNNMFSNNLMIECNMPFCQDERGLEEWYTPKRQETNFASLDRVPYKEGIWAQKYPELGSIVDDEPLLPKYNKITNNVLYQTPDMNIAQSAKDTGTVKDNIRIIDTNSFANYQNRDFTVLDNCEITRLLPDFEPIPFHEIGLKEIGDIEKQAVVLLLGSPLAMVSGEVMQLDADNQKVVPVVEQGRTLVPLRFIAEAFGATVAWENDTVSIRLDGRDITMQPGFDYMQVDGHDVALDVPAKILQERTYVPLRAVGEALNKEVFWDESGLIIVSAVSDLIDGDDRFTIDALTRRITMQ